LINYLYYLTFTDFIIVIILLELISFNFFSCSFWSLANVFLNSSFSFSKSSILSFKTSICNFNYYSTLMWFLTSASYCYNCCSYSFGGKSIDLNVDDNPVSLSECSLPPIPPLFEFSIPNPKLSSPERKFALPAPLILLPSRSLLSSLIYIKISILVLI